MTPVAATTDPVAAGAIGGALALILFVAAWHKLSEPAVFAGALDAYQLMPTRTVELVSRGLPLVEVAVGLAVLAPPTRSPALVALASLMGIYACAIGINLWRGRHQIDCGCGGAAHPLSWGLVARNAVLVAAALAVAGPTSGRRLEWLDGAMLLLGTLAFFGLYQMADELLRQSTRLRRPQAQAGREMDVR
jgi:hypothetical protein